MWVPKDSFLRKCAAEAIYLLALSRTYAEEDWRRKVSQRQVMRIWRRFLA